MTACDLRWYLNLLNISTYTEAVYELQKIMTVMAESIYVSCQKQYNS